jgi:hypothetical protein
VNINTNLTVREGPCFPCQVVMEVCTRVVQAGWKLFCPEITPGNEPFVYSFVKENMWSVLGEPGLGKCPVDREVWPYQVTTTLPISFMPLQQAWPSFSTSLKWLQSKLISSCHFPRRRYLKDSLSACCETLAR